MSSEIKNAIDNLRFSLEEISWFADDKEERARLAKEIQRYASELGTFFPSLKKTEDYQKLKESLKNLQSVKGRILPGRYIKDLEEYGGSIVAMASIEYSKIERIMVRASPKEVRKADVPKRQFASTSQERRLRKKQIFVVHGREKTPALELVRLIEKRYHLETIILEEEAHKGRTLVEKLEDHLGVDFAFIILTPDDLGALKGEPLKERGRQNVIFELGQFIGRIGREKSAYLSREPWRFLQICMVLDIIDLMKVLKSVFLELKTS